MVVAYAGHLAVTGWLWTVPSVRQIVRTRPGRLVLLPAMLVAAGALVGLTTPVNAINWLLVGFFVWQFTHFQRQNLGLVTLVGAKWCATPLTALERRLVVIAGYCGTAVLIARPVLLGLPDHTMTTSLTGPVVRLAMAGLVVCAICTTIASVRQKRPMPVVTAQLAAVSFFVPVFVFESAPAAVTGMVVAHGLQYLWVVGCRSHSGRPRGRFEGWRAAAAVASVAVVGGSLLEAMSELRFAQASGIRMLYGAYLGVVMAHFVVDGTVWRTAAPLRRNSVPVRARVASSTSGVSW